MVYQHVQLGPSHGRPLRLAVHCCAVGKPLFLSLLCRNTIHLPLPTSRVGVWAVGKKYKKLFTTGRWE